MTGYDYSLYYGKWHSTDPEHVEATVRWYLNWLPPLLPVQAGQALDIGCGIGFALLALRSLGWEEVRGIDVDQAQVEAARSIGASVDLVTDTVAWLSDDTTTYDLVLLLDVLEHVTVDAQIDLMRAVHKSLAPGGRCVVKVPNASAIAASHWRYNDFTHRNAFTQQSLRFVLLNAGFSDIGMIAREPRRPPVRLWRRSARDAFIRWLARRAWRRLLRAELGEDGADLPLDLNLTVVAHK